MKITCCDIGPDSVYAEQDNQVRSQQRTTTEVDCHTPVKLQKEKFFTPNSVIGSLKKFPRNCTEVKYARSVKNFRKRSFGRAAAPTVYAEPLTTT